MNWNWKEYKQQKHQFRSYYCAGCKQTKPCQLLARLECCACSYLKEQKRAEEYSNYQLVYQKKEQAEKEHDKQLRILKDYLGCKDCGSKEVDAYFLYKENKLVCQPCRMRKEGGSSHPISFSKQEKWYKRYWRISISEWLENYGFLPVNAGCAREWLKDKNHLNSCNCLEREAKELYDLFANSLKEKQELLKKCSCKTSEKFRVDSDYSTACEKCEKDIAAASKKRVIRNRNNPSFWGLETKEKVLCLTCLKNYIEQMPANKKYTFNKYIKRDYK